VCTTTIVGPRTYQVPGTRYPIRYEVIPGTWYCRALPGIIPGIILPGKVPAASYPAGPTRLGPTVPMQRTLEACIEGMKVPGTIVGNVDRSTVSG